mmetsp:Transcript_57220/g.167996  ORF Transcript_57220/g.167996 Transcript_57220/m.167996 type:complete len:245 (+) Transcript_57220:368-1102(+)
MLDLCGVLEDIEPVHGLHVVDDAEAALQRAVEDYATNTIPGGEVESRHAADRLPVAHDLLLGDVAVVRQVAVGRLNVAVQVRLARHTGALTVAAVLVREDVRVQLRAHLLQVMEHDPDVRAVPVAEEHGPVGIGAVEVEPEDDVAAARPHPHGVDHDALAGQIWKGGEAIVVLYEEDLLLLRHVVARWSRREEGELVHNSRDKAWYQRQAPDATDERVAAREGIAHALQCRRHPCPNYGTRRGP